MGAGGGGHMLFYVDYSKRKKVIESLENIGCRYVPFVFDQSGLQVWWVNNN